MISEHKNMARNRRRHAARRMSGSVRVALAVVLGLAFAGSGGAYAAYRYEASAADRILPGVAVAGVDVSGMTREEAVAAVSGEASRFLDAPLELRANGRTWETTPAQLGTTADVEAKVDMALAVTTSMSWPSRVLHRLLDRPVDAAFDLAFSHDPETVQGFVRTVARAVNVSPSNAEVLFRDGELRLREPKKGYRLRMTPSVEAVMGALEARTDFADLAIRTLKPQVGVRDLGHTIVVRLSENKLYFYDGIKLVKTYPVASGSPGYSTPQGSWTVINKRVHPTWVNPAPTGWGAGLPRVIGPGVGNPLGTRALDLDAPGIRIHGTYASSSIGTYASHGCIRMYIADSEELFEQVPVGTPVHVVW